MHKLDTRLFVQGLDGLNRAAQLFPEHLSGPSLITSKVVKVFTLQLFS